MNDNHDNGGKKQQRIHPRVDFSSLVKIVVPNDNTAIDVVAENVSREGIFLKTDHPLGMGKKVTLEFEINNENIRVDEGEVIWVTDAGTLQSNDVGSGMGVRFNNLSENSKDRIMSFIEEQLNKGERDRSRYKAKLSLKEPKRLPQQFNVDSAGVIDDPTVDQRGDWYQTGQHIAPERDGLTHPAQSPKSQECRAGPSEWGHVEPHRNRLPLSDPGPMRVGKQGERLMVSETSPPRMRWLLFSAFVLVVAVVTFLTIYMIKPIGVEQEDLRAVSTSAVQVEGSEPSSESSKELPKNTDSSPSDQPQVAVDKSDSQPNAVSIGSDEGTVSVKAPEFKKASKGWHMIIHATAEVKTKHFVLKSPPRLVIDFDQATYMGSETTLQSPIPYISRVRIGEEPKHTRIVIDFEGDQIPTHRVETNRDVVTVVF